MKNLLIILLLIGTTTIAIAQTSPKMQPVGSKSSITYKIISAEENTYGYDIYVDGKPSIHQANIPGMPGKKAFKTKADATKVAELVVSKIKNGNMPPTISVEEMKSLKAL